MSQVRPKAERVGEIAAKVVVQLLFATGKSFTVDGLREKLREFYREHRPELRAVAVLNNVELITALISFNRQLAPVGLQVRILNGVTTDYPRRERMLFRSPVAFGKAILFMACHPVERIAVQWHVLLRFGPAGRLCRAGDYLPTLANRRLKQ